MPALLLLFFLSGLSSLVYQVVWLKHLTLLFGSTTPSVTAVLVAFMGGLSLGSWLAGRRAAAVRNPVRWYGVLELGIGASALAVPALFAAASRVFVAAYAPAGGEGPLLDGVRLLLAALVFLVPTTLMGATLPLLAQFAERESAAVGRGTALFYGVNTLGAFAGVLASTFWAVPALGFAATAHLAAALNGVAGLGGLILGRPAAPPSPAPSGEAGAPSVPAWLFAAMGFTSLGFEVFWSRLLAIHIGSNVYAYGLMLSSILAGIGAGSLVYRALLGSTRRPRFWLGAVEALLALSIGLQALALGRLPNLLIRLSSLPWPSPQWQVFGSLFLGVGALLILPCLLMGLSFPLCVRLAAGGPADAGRAAGRVYAFNTLGAIAGAALAGLAVAPLLGTLRGFLAFGAVNALLAVVLLAGRWRWAGAAATAGLAALFALLDPLAPFTEAGMYREPGTRILNSYEDATGVVMVVERPEGMSLEINGVNVAGTSPDNMLIQKLQGHLPLAFRPDARRVLHIGLGSGSTAHAVSLHPVEEIRVAEISPGIARQARENFAAINHRVLEDPRVAVTIADGRNYVLASPRPFDLILSDSIHPKYRGNGFLYTRDYFTLVRRKLEPGGVCSMWLPLYSLTPKNFKEILRAFGEAFPQATVWWFPRPVNAFTVVMGSEAPFTLAPLKELLQMPSVREALAPHGLDGWDALAAACVMGPEGLRALTARVRPHTDDLPSVEYESNRIFARSSTWGLNLRELYDRWEDPAAVLGAAPEDRPALEFRVREHRAAMADQMRSLPGWR
jgi:spermidine synthase